MFGYGQVKTELKLGRLPIRPYLSIRLDGDVKGNIGPTAGSINPAVSIGKLLHLCGRRRYASLARDYGLV